MHGDRRGVWDLSSWVTLPLLGRKVLVRHVALLVANGDRTVLVHAITRRGRGWKRVAKIELVELGVLPFGQALAQVRAGALGRHRGVRVVAELMVDPEVILAHAPTLAARINPLKLSWPTRYSCFKCRRDLLAAAGYDPVELIRSGENTLPSDETSESERASSAPRR